jgi:hypothetical protein
LFAIIRKIKISFVRRYPTPFGRKIRNNSLFLFSPPHPKSMIDFIFLLLFNLTLENSRKNRGANDSKKK